MHTIKDSFEFARIIRETTGSNTYMASFDVRSLFTNVPLMETINICADALFEEENLQISRDSFVRLMQHATSSTEFSLNNEMYRQKDGVAMGSPIGPTLANIFMGHLESEYFRTYGKPGMYYRYVDDCFILFKTQEECNDMFNHFNNLHKSITFTMEVEENGCLPFLDVMVTRKDDMFVTSIYRKKTFSGQYINFLSHCCRKRKINLIKTLCHRAVMICSSSTLESELENISKILCDNGYPENLILRTFKHHREMMTRPKKIGAAKCLVPIKLPFLDTASIFLEKELKHTTAQCYFAVDPRIILNTKPMLSHIFKDRIPMEDTSLVIYHYKCCCGDSYVGQTVRRLGVRMKEHIPACIVKHFERTPVADFTKNVTLRNAAKRSSVAEHLLNNPECGLKLQENKFMILQKCRSVFQLKIMESVLIAAREPNLCKQTEFDFVTCFI